MAEPFVDVTTLIGTGIGSVLGDPLFLGLLVISFFVGYVFLQNQRLDGKIAIIVPGILLAFKFLDVWMRVLLIFFGGVIIAFALYRIYRNYRG